MKLLIALIIATASALAQNPQAVAKIEAARATREKFIAEQIARADALYRANLQQVSTLYGSDAALKAIVTSELAELDKAALVGVPPLIRMNRPLAAGTVAPAPRVVVTNAEGLQKFLIGTKWTVYNNDKPVGVSSVLEFTGVGTLTLGGKAQTFEVVSKDTIKTSGNTLLKFNKDNDGFAGYWVPNPSDKKVGVIIR